MTASPDTALNTQNSPNGKAKGRTAEPPRRAAIYARVSLDQTGEANSVGQQEEVGRELIERRGWDEVGLYVDNSITGTGSQATPVSSRT